MQQLEVKHADDAALNTESETTICLRFTHGKDVGAAEAAALSREALADYCGAYNLDIYERDVDGNRTNGIDEARIVPAFEAYLLNHVLMVVTSHRGAKAERQAKATVAATLNVQAG